MSPITVILQGLPHDYFADKNHENFSIQLKIHLEQLLAIYGPVKCTYLWSLHASQSNHGRTSVADNFAHMTFENLGDALKACEAADNHDIRLDNYVLTLTPVSDELPLINMLNDDCLIEIFTLLELQHRIKIGEVCHRWNEIVEHCYFDLPMLHLNETTESEEKVEFDTKIRTHTKKISVNIQSQGFFNSICTSWQNITRMELDINNCELFSSEPMAVLENLKVFKFRKADYSTVGLDFFLNLPKSLEKISVYLSRRLPISLDITKFENLRKFYVAHCKLAEGALQGIGDLRKLTGLTLICNDVSINDSQNIGTCRHLKTLRLCNIALDDDILTKIVWNNPNITTLTINHANISKNSMRFVLSSLPCLRELEVSYCNSVTFPLSVEMASLELFKYDCFPMNTSNDFLNKFLLLAPNLKYLCLHDSAIMPEFIAFAYSIACNRKKRAALHIETYCYQMQIDCKKLLPFLMISDREGHCLCNRPTSCYE